MKKKLSRIKITISALFLPLLLIGCSPLQTQSLEATYTDSTTGIEFVLVPGGCFEMGNKGEGGSYTEVPVHEVCVDDFYLGKTEVTQGQWLKLMETNPSHFPNGDDYPLDMVTRTQASEFMLKMDEKAAQGHRLPTEAEWEFACRSGGKDEQYCGGDSVEEVAWLYSNSEKRVHPVAQKKPNGLGLYDMSGNVWEFCSDIFAKDYYANSPKDNPQGASEGYHYIKRGGCWAINENFLTSTTRGRSIFEETGFSSGFRVAFSAKP